MAKEHAALLGMFLDVGVVEVLRTVSNDASPWILSVS
jgi:hypothetical protein